MDHDTLLAFLQTLGTDTLHALAREMRNVMARDASDDRRIADYLSCIAAVLKAREASKIG